MAEPVTNAMHNPGSIAAVPSLSRKRERFPTADFLLALSFIGDAAMILLGLTFGFWVRFHSGWIPFFVVEPVPRALNDYLGLILLGTAFLLLAFGFLRLYQVRHLLRFREVTQIILKGTTFWLFAYLGVSLALKFDPPISRAYVVTSYAATLMALLTWRWAFHRFLRNPALSKGLRQKVLIVGWNDEANRLAASIELDPGHPYEVVGCVPSSFGRFQSNPPARVQKLGDYHELQHLMTDRGIDIVVLADLNPTMKEILELTTLCEKEFVQFKVIPSYFQILVSALQLETISGVPILGVNELPLERPANRLIKRALDLLGAAFGLLISAPLILLFGMLINLESPGPIFYRQRRIGRNGRPFDIIKLRSMRLDAENNGAQWAEKDDPRRLKIGALMREWNLDELPQFWNVLKGEMSLVGPRPERPELIANFKHQIPHYNTRHSAKPGITGWAQVNGLRGNTSLLERVRYDIHYLENWSLWFDVQIMFLTFVKKENAY